MTNVLIEIVKQIKDKFTDDSDMLWTSYDSAKEVRDELEGFIVQLADGNTSCLESLSFHFAPTSTFQEHSTQNNWANEYLDLAKRFDEIYTFT